MQKEECRMQKGVGPKALPVRAAGLGQKILE
jgi:hypothetical protein